LGKRLMDLVRTHGGTPVVGWWCVRCGARQEQGMAKAEQAISQRLKPNFFSSSLSPLYAGIGNWHGFS
jgi:hypothetical protein